MEPFTTLAAAGGGVFSAAAAAALGIGSDRIQAAVRTGELVRLTRGWYTTSARLRGGGDEHRHRLRTVAVTRRFGAGVVATHHSALTVYHLPLLRPDLRVVHIGSPAVTKTVHGKGHVIHVLPTRTLTEQATPPAVSPAFGVVQAGLLEGPRASLVAADQAVRRSRPDLLGGPVEFGRCTHAQLEHAVAAYRRVPGIAAVARILALADPKAESVGESLLRQALHLLGVPVESQFPITVGDHTYRADFRVKGTMMLIEFDGLIKLEDPLENRRADERERTLRRRGWIIVRFTWSELGALELIEGRLADAAAAHGLSWPVGA